MGQVAMYLFNVAQISNLPYRRFPIGRLSSPTRLEFSTPAGWKHSDTADWKSIGNLRYDG
jgi:hypothetical protein